MMTENDVLGFDPSQLTVFNQTEQKTSNADPLIYRPRPADSVAEDGVYRATIKVIYNPFDLKNSVIEQQAYSMQDEKGWFQAVSSLTVNDTNCPIFKAWKKCRYADEGSALWKQQAGADKGGNQMFDKRFTRYVTIQVLEDENKPDLVGKYLFWKLPKSIWDIINAKMNPSDAKKASIPVMDFLFGRAIELEVQPGPGKPGEERYTRETKYVGEFSDEVVSCVNPDGSSMLNDDETEVLDTYVTKMNKVWKSKDAETRTALLEEVNADPNTAALKKIYKRVLDNIKTVCPNLTEHLGYKEWNDELKERVNRWIEVVLSGNNPATVNSAPAALTEQTTAPEPAQTHGGSTATFDSFGADDDDTDLPF
jgi:hypothetical protein